MDRQMDRMAETDRGITDKGEVIPIWQPLGNTKTVKNIKYISNWIILNLE